MNKLHLLLPALLVSSISTMANEHLSYTWIELDYVNLDIDGYDNDRNIIEDLNDGNGWGVHGSFGFTNNWFVFSKYSSTKSDVAFIDEFDQIFNSDTDIDRFDLGVGFHMPVADNSDIVLRAAYVDVDVGNFNFGETGNDSFGDLKDDNSDGYLADISFRSQVNKAIEGSVGLRYTEIEKVDNVGLVGNLLFEISSNFGVNLGIDVGDELTTWVLGGRYSF